MTENKSIEIYLVLFGALIKIMVGFLFSSIYLTDLFIPFVQDFVASPTLGHYNSFYENGRTEYFPYPAGMLFILTIPILIVDFLDASSQMNYLVAVKLVFLGLDFIIYLMMRNWLPVSQQSRLALLYWLSPISIYSIYFHGQLDILPFCFLIMSVFLLINRRIMYAGLAFGLAVSVKTHLLLAMPVILLYLLQKEDSLSSILKFFATSVALFISINFPFLSDLSFYSMVFANSEQDKIFIIRTDYINISLYWAILALLFLTGFAAQIGITNRNVFLLFLGLYFSVLLFFVPPMNAWYFWILPFFSFLYAKDPELTVYPFMLFQLSVLVYFLLIPESDFLLNYQLEGAASLQFSSAFEYLTSLNLPAQTFVNISYTILQAFLVMMCYVILRFGIIKYKKSLLLGAPFLIGIGGNSGTGKSTLTENLLKIFGEHRTSILRGDDSHKWQRGADAWQHFTHLNPKANNLHREVNTIRQLKKGKKIWRSMYDHSTGNFTVPLPIVPRNLIIFEGLHPFFLGKQRAMYDLKIFIRPSEDLGKFWKISRDLSKRKYSVDKIIENIEKREEDLNRFVAKQDEFVDLVICPYPINDLSNKNYQDSVEVAYDIYVKNDYNVDTFLVLCNQLPSITVSHQFVDMDWQKLSLQGGLAAPGHLYLEEWITDCLNDYDIWTPDLADGLEGVVSTLVVHLMMEVIQNAR